jgi:hypothetical protein
MIQYCYRIALDPVCFVTIDNIDIDATLKDVEKRLSEDQQSSPAMKSMMGILVMVVK